MSISLFTFSFGKPGTRNEEPQKMLSEVFILSSVIRHVAVKSDLDVSPILERKASCVHTCV